MDGKGGKGFKIKSWKNHLAFTLFWWNQEVEASIIRYEICFSTFWGSLYYISLFKWCTSGIREYKWCEMTFFFFSVKWMTVGILRKFWPNLYFNRVIEENFKSQGAMASIPPDGHWAVRHMLDLLRM